MRRLFVMCLLACFALGSHAADAPSIHLIGIGKPAITLAIEVVGGGTTTRAPRKAD